MDLERTAGPSLGHVGLALLFMAAGAGLWMAGLRGPHWQGAFIGITWFWSRELAQFFRGANKGRPISEFGMAHVRQAGWPSLAVLVVALAVEFRGVVGISW